MTGNYVVIGAGAAGMTTALLLARRGCKVVVVEAAAHPAPLLRGFERDGIHFDTGFHYAGGLAPGEPFARLLRFLGLDQRLQTVPFAADGFDCCRVPGETEFRFPVGEEALAAALTASFPAEREAIGRYLALLQRAWQAFPYMNLAAPVGGAGFVSLDGPSLQQVLDEHFRDPRLKRLLAMHTLLHGATSDEIPFALHACIVGPYYRSAHGFAGGGAALAEAFEAALHAAGVELRCGDGVETLLCDARGAVRGVRLVGGEEIACNGCVATLHPRLLLDLVPAGFFRPAYRHRIERLEESAGGVILYARSRGAATELAARNLFLVHAPETVRQLHGTTLEERPLYLSGCGGDGFLVICPAAVADFESWSTTTRRARPADYRRYKEELVALLCRRLTREAPELAAGLEVLAAATPLTYRDYVVSPFGSLYGVKHCVGQINPQPQTRIPGLWLAGQATASPGVLGAMLSGVLVCGAIFGHDELREELKRCA